MMLKNAWYVAAMPQEIGRTPLGRTILGEPVLLYRRESGEAVALEDRCRHRRAPLSLGKLVGDAVQCPYHGFTFDAEGRCIWVPGQDETPGRHFGIRAYPVAEKHAWVWIWPGDPALADPAAIPDFGTRDDPAWAATGDLIPARANYLLFVENLMDLSHLAFVHTSSIGSAQDLGATLDLDRGERHVRLIRTAPPFPTPPLLKNLGFGASVEQRKVITFTPPCNITIDITTSDAGAPLGAAPRRTRYQVLNSITPATETTCLYFWGHSRDFDLGDAGLTALFHRETTKAFAEDRDIIEAQQRVIDLDPAAPTVSIKADWGGVQALRLMSQLVGAERAAAGVAAA